MKATFAIDDSILQDARDFVKTNRLKSLSAFVEQSISKELARMRQEKIRNALLSAGNDPMFMADVIDINQAFEHTDLNTAS